VKDVTYHTFVSFLNRRPSLIRGQNLIMRMAHGAWMAGRRPEDIAVTLFIPTFVSNDHAAAREAARRFLATYPPIPFYNNAFRRRGFASEIERFNEALGHGNRLEGAARISDRLMDAICLIGLPHAVASIWRRFGRRAS